MVGGSSVWGFSAHSGFVAGALGEWPALWLLACWGIWVQVASWEILAAMLTGEALFGVQGLVAAPLLYPFFKREVSRLRGLDAH